MSNKDHAVRYFESEAYVIINNSKLDKETKDVLLRLSEEIARMVKKITVN